MAAFVALTALYYGILLFIFAGRFRAAQNKVLNENTVLSREHTDAIKGIAAMGIVISHIAAYIKYGVQGFPRYYVVLGTTLGGIGVNLFFFASGFGNYYSAKRIKSLRMQTSWLIRRVLSILNIFIICFVLTSIFLQIEGYSQSLGEMVRGVLRLRMPLTITWYVKVQILLYVILTVSLFFEYKIQSILLIGFSFISSYSLYKLGYAEEWWKSTLCFALGYYVAMHKTDIVRVINRRNHLWFYGSLAAFPLLFIMACLIDNYWIKVLGNTLLVADMLIIAEFFEPGNHLFEKIGTFSLEIYLIHISLCGWFLQDRIPDSIGICKIVIWTVAIAILAKMIDDKIAARIRKIN